MKTFIAILSGFQFGYNTAVIAGALLFLAGAFDWNAGEEGFVVSVLLIGAFIGASLGGTLANRCGRKKSLHLMALLFLVSGVVVAIAPSTLLFLLGRLFQGFGVGVVSMLTPIYLAEISPPKNRGKIVTANQLAIAIGILAAYGANLLFARSGNFRMMFALGIVPAIIQCIGFFFLPESPLQKESHKASWKTIFEPKYRKILLLALFLNIFQQITGINAVIYFAPQIFQEAGLSSARSAILATLGVGIINMVATVFSLWVIDRVGRRPLLLWGLVGMIASLCFIAFAFYTESFMIDEVAVGAFMLYVAAFAIGLGPVTGLVVTEITPTPLRGNMMSIAAFSNWTCNYLVSLTFLDLIQTITSAGTFSLFALLSIIALFFFYKNLPETKGQAI